MIILQTERLTLRQFQLSDEREMRVVFGDAEVMRFGDGVQNDKWIRNWLGECIEDYYGKRGYGPWCVMEANSQQVIGYCGLFFFPDINGQPQIEIGYRLARPSWGQGYATEAVLAVRDYAFDNLGLKRLIAMVDPHNVRSLRVVEKAGMTYEQQVMFDGYTHPDHIYSISRTSAPRRKYVAIG